MRTRPAVVLGLGLLLAPVAYVVAAVLTTFIYERWYLPLIAGEE